MTAGLGALGEKAGPGIPYQWSRPSRWPQFLPALALLLLLLPKRNRCLQAFWVAVPVLLSLAVQSMLWAVPGIGSDAPGGMFEVLSVVPFGLAAVWLLSPYLKARARFLTFLGVLAIMELFGLLTRPVVQQWDGDGGLVYMLIGVEVLGLVLSLAINLTGWSCRGRFDRRRLSVWLVLWLMAGWLACFAVISGIEGPGPLLEMAIAFVIVSAVSLGWLLPFLLLSFTNAFYRERLKELLHLVEAAPSPAAQPPAA